MAIVQTPKKPLSTLLVVDDFEPFRRFVSLRLQQRADFQVIAQASDGLEAVQKTEQLQPDLILLDVGLPTLNGIEVAERVRKVSPNTRILFLSQEASPDVVQESLRLGAMGYLIKSQAGSELLPAIEAVLGGKRFVSSGLEDFKFTEAPNPEAPHRHEVQFYSDDTVFLESFTDFIAAALKSGNAAIVIATKSHRDGLLQRLKAECVDVDGAIQRGTYLSLDATDSLSTIMVNGLPDPVRFFKGISGLIEAVSKAAKAEHPRVAFCGERVGLLWAEGKTDAAIRLEQLCNDLAKTHQVDILCAYPLTSIHGEEGKHAIQTICTEHSAVYSR